MNVAFSTTVSDFPPGNMWAVTNGWRSETFTWSDILRAAMVTGYPSLTSIPSRQFARWRTAGFHLALRHRGGQLIQPPEWRRLDPSEKGAAASLLGLVVTKLVVERLLSAPIFLFLDVYFTVIYPTGTRRTRPDFIARSVTGQWIPAEAKGQSRFRRKTLTNGKIQARGIGSVNGQSVSTAVVCVTSFRGGVMQARFADPEPEPEESGSVEIEPMEAFGRYYHQLDRFKQTSEPLGERIVPETNLRVELWRSEGLDVEFGVIPEVETALRERSPEHVLSILKRLADPQVAVEHPFLGPDGIVVLPGRSWQSDD